MRRRIGRDASFIPLMLGPLGIGIPKWMVLVVVYFAVVFTLGWSEAPDDRSSTFAAALGPGVIGLIDLGLRLRTTHYHWTSPTAGPMIARAGIVDRLTFQECGWYLPLLALPLPLWLVGLGLSAAFARSWGLL